MLSPTFALLGRLGPLCAESHRTILNQHERRFFMTYCYKQHAAIWTPRLSHLSRLYFPPCGHSTSSHWEGGGRRPVCGLFELGIAGVVVATSAGNDRTYRHAGNPHQLAMAPATHPPGLRLLSEISGGMFQKNSANRASSSHITGPFGLAVAAPIFGRCL